jgi:hypothetical protein
MNGKRRNLMAEDNSSQITKTVREKKWILVGCGLVILFVVALFLIIFWVGMESANPWGEAPGPGP